MPQHFDGSTPGTCGEFSARDASTTEISAEDVRRDQAKENESLVAKDTAVGAHGTLNNGESGSDRANGEDARTIPELANVEMASEIHTRNIDDENSENDDFRDARSSPLPQTPAVKPAQAQQEVSAKDTKSAENGNTAIKDSTGLEAHPSESVDVKKAQNESSLGHRRGQSSRSNGISEWSHQHLAPKETEEEEEVEEDEWQPMPAFAPFDIYDDDNKLVARETQESDDEAAAYAGLGGAGKGYTRVQMDEDAQSATSLDENTQYLFKEANGTTTAGFEDDDEQRDAASQLQTTKDLLTEGQRIAYVGMTRITLSAMVDDCNAMVDKTKGTRKETALAAEAMKLWSQQMMVRLYAHMEISAAEQIMIEQLSEHGVQPGDLTPTLMQNTRVKNPAASSASPRSGSVVSTDKSPQASASSPRVQEEESASPPPPYAENESHDVPEVLTPSELPMTKNIDIDLRWTILCDLFLVLIADSSYDARSRVLLEKVGKHLSVSWLEICRFEKRVTDALEMQQAAQKENWNEDEHKESRRKMALKTRYVMMGLATVGGGLVIGLSAGLAAPLIGAGLAVGFSAIGVAGTGSFLAGTAGIALITSAAASSGSIIAVRAANRRTGAVKTFEYRPLHNNKRVNLIVTVSGWMTGKVDDVRLPYSTVDPIMGDIYSVLWEPEMLTSMGDTINILATEALTQGLQQILASTVLMGLMGALQLPVVLTKLAYLIDNPWTVSLERATAAGLILADSLIDRNLGTRPITFVGYSLGCRVIFSCLRELARKGAFGLVQNVYLFGSPIVAKKDDYIKARTVVAGRFVNGYARNDWILGYLFRLTSGGVSRIAGLAPVKDVPGVENVDVTEIVPGHMAYRAAMPLLLREVGWLVESDEFTEIEDADPDNHQERQRELINEIEEARKEYEKQEKEKESKGTFGFFSRGKRKVVEKKDWETYESKAQDDIKKKTAETSEVLFDVDAIRAELASEHMEVKELKSTLPPMKLTLSPPPAPQPPSTPRQTKSFETSPTRRSRDTRPELRSPPIVALSSHEDEEEEVQMSFDSPYMSPPRYNRSPAPAPSPPPRMPAKMADPVYVPRRPELQSSNTLPAMSSPSAMSSPPPPTMSLDHNAWADDDDDDDDEFREKEMEMTFA